MIESCTIAYLKEFCIAFMLYLILILTCDANFVIFTSKMKPLMPWICHKNFPFKKSEEIWNMKRSTFRLSTRIQWHFIKEYFGQKKINLRPPHQNAINCVIKPFEESEGLTGRGQTKEDWHMAVTPVNIKFVKDYFTADLSSICTVSHNCDLSYSL